MQANASNFVTKIKKDRDEKKDARLRLLGLMDGIGNTPVAATRKQLDHFGDNLMTSETTNVTPM